MLVVGHSFGGAIAMQLAAARPDQVAALLLLDPAIGLDGVWMSEIAEAMFGFPDYTDAAEARTEKMTGSWADVDPALLDAELDEHLVAAAQRAVRLAGQHAGDDVLLERAGPRHRVTAPGNDDDAGAGQVDVAALCHRSAGRRPGAAIGSRFSTAGFRVQPHGAQCQTRPKSPR